MPNPQVQAQALGSVDQADDRRSCQCSKVDLRCKSRPTAGKKIDTGCKTVSDGSNNNNSNERSNSGSSSSSSSSITSNHRRGKRIRVQAFQGGLLLGCEALKGGKGLVCLLARYR